MEAGISLDKRLMRKVEVDGEGNGNPLHSSLENPMDRGAWQTTVHGVARVGHDLGIKPPPSQAVYILIYYWLDIFQAVL